MKTPLPALTKSRGVRLEAIIASMKSVGLAPSTSRKSNKRPIAPSACAFAEFISRNGHQLDPDMRKYREATEIEWRQIVAKLGFTSVMDVIINHAERAFGSHALIANALWPFTLNQYQKATHGIENAFTPQQVVWWVTGVRHDERALDAAWHNAVQELTIYRALLRLEALLEGRGTINNNGAMPQANNRAKVKVRVSHGSVVRINRYDLIDFSHPTYYSWRGFYRLCAELDGMKPGETYTREEFEAAMRRYYPRVWERWGMEMPSPEQSMAIARRHYNAESPVHQIDPTESLTRAQYAHVHEQTRWGRGTGGDTVPIRPPNDPAMEKLFAPEPISA